MKKSWTYWPRIIGFAFLAFLLLSFSAACQGKKTEEAPLTPGAGIITLDDAKSVLGTARDDVSGVIDLNKDRDEVLISYRYYDVDLENYEMDFATEIAPRIQSLYRKFKTLDRVHLQITANSPSTPGLWKPFAEFTLDRKTVEELHWTGFVARYLLDLALKNKRS